MGSRATRDCAARRGPAAAAALLALAVALAAPRAHAAAGAPWVQRTFLVGGCCGSYDPDDLVALDAAGLDVVTNQSQAPSALAGRRFVATLDSLRRARPGFHLRGVPFLRVPGGSPGDITQNDDPRANRDAIARTFRTGGFAGDAIAGWGVWDEPCDSATVARAVDLVRLVRALPETRGGFPLVNLVGMPAPGRSQCYEGAFHAAGASRPDRFAAYADAFLGAFGADEPPAPMLCFDDYPFASDTLSGEWLESLRVASQRAAAYGRADQRVPLWVIVQASPQKRKGRPWHAEPSARQTAWQVWTALAYGAKGIWYWTAAPVYAEFVGAGWGPGLLDFTGRRTARYTSFAALDRTLHALGPVLMSLDPVTVFHGGTGNQSGVAMERIGAPEQIYGLVRGVTGAGAAECTIGDLKHRVTHDDYLVVVNRSLGRTNTFTLTLDAPATRVEQFDGATGRPRLLARGARTLRVGPLAPASGVLLHIAGSTGEHRRGGGR